MTFTSGSVDGHYLYNVRTGVSVWPAGTKLVQVVEHGVLAEQFRMIFVLTQGRTPLCNQNNDITTKSKVDDRESHATSGADLGEHNTASWLSNAECP